MRNRPASSQALAMLPFMDRSTGRVPARFLSNGGTRIGGFRLNERLRGVRACVRVVADQLDRHHPCVGRWVVLEDGDRFGEHISLFRSAATLLASAAREGMQRHQADAGMGIIEQTYQAGQSIRD